MITAGPVVGLIGTIGGMLAAFYGISLGGDEKSTDMVATGISGALMTTWIGFLIFPIGVLMLIVSIAFHLKAEREFEERSSD